ncbi:hypothetical protein A6V39_04965 [Candidatus Mycoplasma haematobovis]|uniref:Uncharacterized protein n=1 Tax=Candidatus Mycoplasma haematobovis TaxID=432608 RepID=A0A1A9QC04_9MOLU|nr:hypothetical protein [Candidatus Mycoplasma haematobovis]OAL09778.1 hypothetical protein A6V39_04965 [Candidatus Mycoplasma haematobovis]
MNLIKKNNGTKLKKECEKWLNSDSEKDIENVKKWCGIRLISNEIARRKKILFTKVEGVGLDWNNTYSQRMRLNSDTSHLRLGVDKLTDDEKWLKVVQGWCKKVEGSDYLASTKNIAKLTEDWCTKEGVNQ